MNTRWIPMALALVLSGCKKLSDAPELPEGRMEARLHFINGTDDFSAGDVVHDGTGRAVAVDAFRFIAGPLWVQDDRHQVLATFPTNRWVVQQPLASTYPIGALPAGHMHALVLLLGVPGTVLPDASWYTADGAPFYIELSGRMDADGDGTVQPADPTVHLLCGEEPFSYAMAGSHQDVLPGATNELAMRIDMARMLEQIDVSASGNNMPGDSVSLQLARNLSAAITGM